jgi:hypothetical protein
MEGVLIQMVGGRLAFILDSKYLPYALRFLPNRQFGPVHFRTVGSNATVGDDPLLFKS